MLDFFSKLFDTADFPARWNCGHWTTGHGWLTIMSDLGVWSAYVAIPCLLVYFAWRRRDIPFRRILILFGAFILACGTTHLMEAIIFYWPAYRLATVIKLFTAIISWVTALAMVPVVPKVLAMRSPEDFEKEIASRRQAEQALAKANEELQQRIEALRASEERFRLLVEGSKDYAIFMLDPTGRIVSWNPGAERIKQYQASEIVGRHFSRFYPDEDIQARKPEMELQVAAAEGKYEEEGWRVRKDGSKFWASVVLTALRDEHGKLRGFGKVTRDVTERKQAEENARRLLQEEAARKAAEESAKVIERQREQLRVTLTSIGDAVVVTDFKGQVTLMNPVAEKLTGWDDSAIGRPLKEVFHIVNEETRRPVESPVDRVIREGNIVGLANHTALLAHDGTERPIEDSAAPIRTNNGEVVGVVLVFRDASDRRRAEHAILASQRREKERADELEATFKATPAPIWIAHDPECHHIVGNPASFELLGLPEGANVSATSIQQNPNERGFREYKGDEPIPPHELPVQRAARGEIVRGAEVKFVFDDGRVRYIYGNAVPLRNPDGSPRGSVAAFVDVTPLKEAQEALRRQEETLRKTTEQLQIVTGSMSTPVTRCSRDMRYLWVNKPYADWLARPAEEIVGRPVREIVGDQAFAELLPHFERVLTGKIVRYEEQVHFRGIGLRWIDAVYTPTMDASGSCDGWVAVVIDITDRKKMEDELRDADRRKNEFLATLAHELRNPLAPLSNGLELIRLAEGDAEHVEKARGLMKRQLDHLVHLVDDLLDMNRISRGKVRLRKEPVKLRNAIRNALEAAQPFIQDRAHELTVALPADYIFLDADPTRLSQIVLNLLSNAAKYTEKGGRIKLTAERQGDEAVISVRDTGVGIAREQLPHLFEMFSQVTPALERTQGGLGIGLALVRGLVELHGGRVEARSAGIGKGSEFIVRLPVMESPPHDPDPAEVKRAAPARHWRILAVDDNRDAVDSLASMLQIAGHVIRTAYDGLEATEVAEVFRPEVVLLDIGLPKMNGYEVARHIRQQPWGKSVILIALTGWGQEDDKRRATESGFDHHLTKPVEPTALENLLASIKAAREP